MRFELQRVNELNQNIQPLDFPYLFGRDLKRDGLYLGVVFDSRNHGPHKSANNLKIFQHRIEFSKQYF